MDSVDSISTHKVIVVGAHKTGTTSLASALSSLGYRVAGFVIPGFEPESLRGLDRGAARRRVVDAASTMLESFDCAQDTPWWEIYPELDQRFPGSRFILTTRDPDLWLESVVHHFGGEDIAHHEWIYGDGSVSRSPARYRSHFVSHNQAVRDYFADRHDDLLVMDLAAGDGWPELCGFLGQPVPPYEFPHANSSADRGSAGGRLWRRMTRGWERRRHGTDPFSRALDMQVAAPAAARVVRLALPQVLASADEALLADLIRLLEDQTEAVAGLKSALGLVYVAQTSDSPVDAWATFQYEFLSLFGQLEESVVDEVVDGGTAEQVAAQILAAVQAFGAQASSRC
jgi:hypothetical protein